MTIFFDLDGTVIDSTEAIVESFFQACRKYDFTLPREEEITKLIGYPLDVMFSSVGVAKEKVWDFVDAYKKHYRMISKEKTVLLPYAKEAIMEAASFARLGIVTTKTGRYSQELMEHFGLMEYFEVLIGREDVTYPKPDGEPVLRAIEAMGIDRTERIYLIGDTKLDMECAANAGIEAVGVLSGYGSREELASYDVVICDHVLSAVHFLQKAKK